MSQSPLATACRPVQTIAKVAHGPWHAWESLGLLTSATAQSRARASLLCVPITPLLIRGQGCQATPLRASLISRAEATVCKPTRSFDEHVEQPPLHTDSKKKKKYLVLWQYSISTLVMGNHAIARQDRRCFLSAVAPGRVERSRAIRKRTRKRVAVIKVWGASTARALIHNPTLPTDR